MATEKPEPAPNRRNPRRQGDLGELSAMDWLASKGAHIFVPVGHSPDVDFIAEVGGVLHRIEVKTGTYQNANGRWEIGISTRGGNQSWSGLVKYFDPSRCEYLFVVVGDGRRWFIPSGALECKAGLTLGGPKYGPYEVEPGRPLTMSTSDLDLQSPIAEGEYPRGQRMAAVNRPAQSFAGSTPASPTSKTRGPLKPTKYERSFGRSGRAVINQKRRLTIPQQPLFQSGLHDGNTVQVRCDGPGRLLVERAELPSWAQPELLPANETENEAD